MGGAKYMEVQVNHLAAKLSSEGSFSCGLKSVIHPMNDFCLLERCRCK